MRQPIHGVTALTVLVVDDDPFAREVMVELLASHGVTAVTTASSGVQAMRTLTELQPMPDLIICDVFMPEMDGIELMDWLSQQHYRGAVLLLSGVDLEMLDLARDLANANGIHLVGAYPKPLPNAVMAELLQNVVDGH